MVRKDYIENEIEKAARALRMMLDRLLKLNTESTNSESRFAAFALFYNETGIDLNALLELDNESIKKEIVAKSGYDGLADFARILIVMNETLDESEKLKNDRRCVEFMEACLLESETYSLQLAHELALLKKRIMRKTNP